MFIGLLLFFITAAAFTAIVKRVPRNVRAPESRLSRRIRLPVLTIGTRPKEMLALTFDYIETPGGPADKAGLVGGDIITIS